jgi:hypothetical protein
MELKIEKMAHHRNGVGGAPFEVAIVNDPQEGQMLVVMFEEQGHTAVFNLQKLTQGVIEFGENSYRGDKFEAELRDEMYKSEPIDVEAYAKSLGIQIVNVG